MKHLEADVIAQLIIDLNMGTESVDGGDWPVYVNSIGDQPHQAISVYTNDMPRQGRTHKDGKTQGLYGFYIRVRDETQQLAHSKMNELMMKFDSIIRKRVTVEDQNYEIQGINQLMTPAFLGPDTNARVSFSLSCSAAIKEV